MVYLILASRNAFFEKMGKIWFGRNCERTFPPGTFNLQFAGKEWVGCGPHNSVSRLVRSFATTCHHRPLAGSVSKRVNPDDKTGPHAANHFWADNSWPRKKSLGFSWCCVNLWQHNIHAVDNNPRPDRFLFPPRCRLHGGNLSSSGLRCLCCG